MTTNLNVNVEEYRQLIVVIQQTQTSIANLQAQQKDCDKALKQIKDRKYTINYEDEFDEILCYGIFLQKKLYG